MKCPFCHEKIERNAKICSVCGESIPQIYSMINCSKELLLKIIKSKPFILSIIMAVVLFFGAGIAISITDTMPKPEKIETYMSSSDILEDYKTPIDIATYKILKFDENNRQKASNNFDLMKYLQELNSLVQNFNSKFNYEDDFYNGNDKVMERYRNLNDGNDVYAGELRLAPIFTTKKIQDSEVEVVEKVEIEAPSIPLLRLVYAGEGYYEVEPNYKYINKVYGNYLSKECQDYLKLKIKEQDYRGYLAYWLDGCISITSEGLKNMIIEYVNFSNTYPNFYNKEIKSQIMDYIRNFIWSKYGTFEINNDKLLPETKKAYEQLLKNLDKESEIYLIIDKYYNILKKHDFEFSNEFRETYDKEKFE